jgi:threonylcarbamoyladenosine tRNA methylthiotransferase MtaB
MQNQIPGDSKAGRMNALMEAAEKQAEAFREASKGEVRRVLVEAFDEEGAATGYTDNYLKVYIPDKQAEFNKFYDVKLLDKHKDGMSGEIVSGRERR